MATTTYEAHRDAQIVLIRALTPTSIAGVRFRVSLDELDFRDWAESHARDSFRRYTIEDLHESEPSSPINEERWIEGVQEIVIAYPHQHKYGSKNRRDMRDVIAEDFKTVDDAVGTRGYGNLTDAVNLTVGEYTLELGESVDFLIITHEFRLWRA